MSFLKRISVPSEGKRSSVSSRPTSTKTSPVGSPKPSKLPDRQRVRFGFVHKDGGFGKLSWDKRYFVLWADGSLDYYKNVLPPSNEKEIADISRGEFKGSINVLTCQIKVGKPRSKKDFVLELSLQERTFFMGFDSSIEMILWDGAMRQLAFKLEKTKTPEQRRTERKQRAVSVIKRKQDDCSTPPNEFEELNTLQEEPDPVVSSLRLQVEQLNSEKIQLNLEKETLTASLDAKDVEFAKSTKLVCDLRTILKELEVDRKQSELELETMVQHHQLEKQRLQDDIQVQITRYTLLQEEMMSKYEDQDLMTQLTKYQQVERDLNEKIRNEKVINHDLSQQLHTKQYEVASLQEQFTVMKSENIKLNETVNRLEPVQTQYEQMKLEFLSNKDKIILLTKRIEALEFDNHELTHKTAKPKGIEPIKSTPKPLGELDRKGSNVHGFGRMQMLVDRIQKNDPKLVEAKFVEYGLVEEDLKRICIALAKNTHVKKVDFSSNSLINASSSVEEICSLITQNQTIQEMVFDNCPLEKSAIVKILKVLHTNTTLLQFTCGSNESDEDINHIEDILDRNYEKSTK